jgi:uncharacterized protein YdaU (DUF1376 family)
MPLYVTDYLGDTGHLSTLEHGAYLLLIMHYWQHESLPTLDDDLAIIARMTKKDWMKIRAKLYLFFQSGWKHKRIDAELIEAQDKYEKRVSAGREGGRAKAKRVALEKQLAQQNASKASSNATGDASSDASSNSGSKPLANGYQPQPHTSYPSRKGSSQDLGDSSVYQDRALPSPPDRGLGNDWDEHATFGGGR